MIEAIWNLGMYVNSKEKKDDSNSIIETYIDRAKLAKTRKILCIMLSEESGGFQYKGISIEDYSPEKPILYRPRSSNGPDILPCAIITGPTKTFKNKIMAWFKNYKDLDARFSSIDKVLNEKKEIIETELKAAYDSLKVDKESGIDKRTNVLLTVKFVENGTERHLGEIQLFRDIFLALSRERYYSYKSTGESRGKGICYLCGQEKELGGYVLSSLGFKFATPDKPGFTPNFRKTDYWKAIQICYDCAEIIEFGKRFIDENMSFPKGDNFLGCRYYVIPKFLFGEMFDEFYSRILQYKNKDYDEGLITREDWIEKEIAKKDDVLRLIFLFYEKDNSRFLIHEYVEDVVPSWLKQIDESQEKIKNEPIFQEDSMKKIFGKNWIGDFVARISKSKIDPEPGKKGKVNNWYVVFLRAFYPKESAAGNYDNEFRSIISAILSNKRISRDLIINSFMREIRGHIRQKDIYDGFQIICVKSFMLYLFLRDLGLIGEKSLGGYDKMDQENKKEDFPKRFSERVEDFFDKYGIKEADKRAAFCVGILSDHVLYVQRIERGKKFGEEPFWDKLHGLMLDESRIKSIFRDSIIKLRQYGKGYPDLEEVAGLCLAAAEGKWNSTKDEISYFFALGITLSKVLSSKGDQVEEKEIEGGK
jgi:CRISPR-associated protein Csh1